MAWDVIPLVSSELCTTLRVTSVTWERSRRALGLSAAARPGQRLSKAPSQWQHLQVRAAGCDWWHWERGRRARAAFLG